MGTTSRPVRSIEYELMLVNRHLLPISRSGGPRMDRSAHVVLRRLELDGPMTLAELSEAFGLGVSTLSRQTNAMLRAGLLEKVADTSPGRSRRLAPTAEGLARIRAERRRNVDGLRRVVQDWSDRDVTRFAALLERFNTDIEERIGHTWPRP